MIAAQNPVTVSAPLAPAGDLAQPSSKGHTWTEQCLGAVAEIATALHRGDETGAQSARRTLDTLCWTPEGYPTFVADALDGLGLRSK